jgi:hypothetical protein
MLKIILKLQVTEYKTGEERCNWHVFLLLITRRHISLNILKKLFKIKFFVIYILSLVLKYLSQDIFWKLALHCYFLLVAGCSREAEYKPPLHAVEATEVATDSGSHHNS